MANPYTPWRTLRGVEVVCRDNMPEFFTGNASVIFRVKHEGKDKILKCYTRRNTHLQAIYGKSFYPAELGVSNILGQRHWVDCLLTDYVEGVSLHEVLCRPLTAKELSQLAKAFDDFALKLLEKDYAHGDLKPENIIVGDDGSFHAIDWDAAYVPSLQGNRATETGTAAYQHPMRTMELYDKHLDDYSIAFLSTLLHAYAANPSQAEYYRLHHEPQVHPRQITHPRPNYNFIHQLNIDSAPELSWLDQTLDDFARRCWARQYRIARLLYDNTPQLFALKRLMSLSATGSSNELEADVHHGLWGYNAEDGWVIAPYYDECNDPKDEILQVRLGGYKHLLTTDGRKIFTTPATTKLKIRGDEISIKTEGGEQRIINIKKLEHIQ